MLNLKCLKQICLHDLYQKLSNQLQTRSAKIRQKYSKESQKESNTIFFSNLVMYQFSFRFSKLFVIVLYNRQSVLCYNIMTSSKQVAKDLFCGCASGWGQVISMLPFQNIKVKVVSRPQEYKGYFHAFQKTVAEEGFLSFYKGMLMPLLGVGAQVALQFGVVESLKKIIKTKYADAQGNLHWKYSFLSGACAGLPSALVVTVLDHARFRVLLRTKSGPGSIQTALDIYRQHGLRKLYLGFNATWLRESFLGIYFGVYDSLMSYSKREKFNLETASLISGGLAGVATWATMYPVDYAKTILQSDSLTQPKYKNSIQCLRSSVKEKGIKVMYTGFNIMILRAFKVNAVGFLCFQYAKKLVY